MKEKLAGLIKQFLKFGAVGGMAFLIDYGALFVLSEVFGIYYLIANAISFTVSVIFNYTCSMKFVFSGKEGMSKRKEFVIFVILSVLGLLVNEFLMWLGVDIFNLFNISNTISYYWVTDIDNQQYAVPNYLTSRRVNFKIVANF